jgi:hypothetical protein
VPPAGLANHGFADFRDNIRINAIHAKIDPEGFLSARCEKYSPGV